MKDLFTSEELLEAAKPFMDGGARLTPRLMRVIINEMQRDPFKPEVGQVYMVRSNTDYPIIMPDHEVDPTLLRELTLRELPSRVCAYVEGIRKLANTDSVEYTATEAIEFAAQILEDNPIEG